MNVHARSPEELETLMEDALLLGDRYALADLFVGNSVFAIQVGGEELRGKKGVARLIGMSDSGAATYLAQPRRIFQAGRIALLIGDGVINVAQRSNDHSWRFLFSIHGHFEWCGTDLSASQDQSNPQATREKRRNQGMYTMMVKMLMDPNRSDELVQHIEQDVLPWAKRQAGFMSGQWLYVPGGSEAVGLVVFDSAEAANTAANDPRDYAEHEKDPHRAWTIEEVTVFEQIQTA